MCFNNVYQKTSFLVFCVSLGVTVCQAGEATLDDAVQRSKTLKARELSSKLDNALGRDNKVFGATMTLPELPPIAPPPPPSPVIRALYGVDGALQAELMYDGKEMMVSSRDADVNIGPWRFVQVSKDGVVLWKSSQSKTSRSSLGKFAPPDRRCEKAEIKQSLCLVLSVPRNAADLPWTSTVGLDSQASYFAQQRPGSQHSNSVGGKAPLPLPLYSR